MAEHDELIARLETYYDFQCEGGPLRNCVEWQQLKAALAASKQRETELRQLLWVRHGCPVAILYGDDGEMQCNAAHPGYGVLDFKRMPLLTLVGAALAAALAAAEQRATQAEAERDEALAILAPNMPSSGLVDACKQVKQAAISEADSSEKLEAQVAQLRAALEKASRRAHEAEKHVKCERRATLAGLLNCFVSSRWEDCDELRCMADRALLGREQPPHEPTSR